MPGDGQIMHGSHLLMLLHCRVGFQLVNVEGGHRHSVHKRTHLLEKVIKPKTKENQKNP